MKDLSENQKQELERAMEEYKQMRLKSFSVTRSGEVIKKQEFSKPREVTITENGVKFQGMFDQSLHHALVNQSGIILTSVQNAVKTAMNDQVY